MDSLKDSARHIYLSASKRAAGFYEDFKTTEHAFTIGLAILIGALAGFGAIGIRHLIKFISDLSFGEHESLLLAIMQAPWYVKILVPTIGGIIVGPIIYFFAPEAKGHGVPEVMQSILLKGGNIRPRVALVKAFASAVTIGTGGSVGREGPIIQIGASLGSTVGQFFRVRSNRLKTLVGCGAAAGIAAAFNAPIAGALFAVEIILMDFTVASFSPIVIASVMATVVSHTFEGNVPAFQLPDVGAGYYTLKSPYEIGFYFILGALAGIVSYLFIKVLYFFEDFFDEKVKIPEYSKAAIGGLLIGLIALIFPHVLGVGYDGIDQALVGKTTWWGSFAADLHKFWWVALVLLFVKILATSITLGSGGSGGIFAPSLFMGAMLGAFFGTLVNTAFPEITAGEGSYALVAMGGLVAGTTRAPITAIIIVFELTKDYDVILPLMIVCIIATILSTKLSRESIYTLKLVKRNIKIKERAETNILKSLLVRDVYKKNFEFIYEDADFNRVVNTMLTKKSSFVSVLSLKKKRFLGVIALQDIKDMMFEKDVLKYAVIAGDIADGGIPTLTPNDNCREAMKKLGRCVYDGLPVVDPDNPKRQIGVVWRKDVDEAYQKEIEKIELSSDLAHLITMDNAKQDVHFLEGYVTTEIKAPDIFIDKSIKELQIRNRYGAEILSIKSQSKSGREIKAIPSADYVIRKDDVIIFAGKAEDIEKLRLLG